MNIMLINAYDPKCIIIFIKGMHQTVACPIPVHKFSHKLITHKNIHSFKTVWYGNAIRVTSL